MLIGYIVKLLAIIALYIYMYSINKRRDREQAVLNGDSMEAEEQREKTRREGIEGGMHDLTEIDNPGFRYAL